MFFSRFCYAKRSHRPDCILACMILRAESCLALSRTSLSQIQIHVFFFVFHELACRLENEDADSKLIRSELLAKCLLQMGDNLYNRD
jgi:hypothetical protein